jgi:hypothetical protein
MIAYNKVYEKKDGRKLVATGPRSNQIRQKLQQEEAPVAVDTLAIEELKNELKNITSKILDKPSANGYTKEQVDKMVNTAIEEVSIDLEKKYIFEIDTLKKSLAISTDKVKELTVTNLGLQERVDKKDDVILELTTKLSKGPAVIMATDGMSYTPDESDRPSMDNVYIDPTEKGAGEGMEAHLTVKEVKSQKPKLASNVNKLKELMGGKVTNDKEFNKTSGPQDRVPKIKNKYKSTK